jgi:hypothetical protein
MVNEDKLSTAFHEAGHSVFGAILGESPADAMIYEVSGVWQGNFDISKRSMPDASVIQIAAAGPFAQLKCRAIRKFGTVSFDVNDRLSDILALIRDPDACDDSMFSVSVSFRQPNGTCESFVVKDGDDLGDFEEIAPLAEKFSDDEICSLMKGVQCRMDTPSEWAAIREVAEVLDQDLRIYGHRIAAIVRNHIGSQ